MKQINWFKQVLGTFAVIPKEQGKEKPTEIDYFIKWCQCCIFCEYLNNCKYI